MGYKLTVSDIDLLLENVKLLAKDMEIVGERVVSKLVTSGEGWAKFQNTIAPQSGLQKSDIISEVDGPVGFIALRGNSAVYDEFGTGDEGANDPHPLKDYFGLNPYNSGPTIFYNQFANRNQWRYKPMAGYPYFTNTGLTSGVPSGKQMYNTSIYLNSIKNDIIKKELQETIKKFNKKR